MWRLGAGSGVPEGSGGEPSRSWTPGVLRPASHGPDSARMGRGPCAESLVAMAAGSLVGGARGCWEVGNRAAGGAEGTASAGRCGPPWEGEVGVTAARAQAPRERESWEEGAVRGWGEPGRGRALEAHREGPPSMTGPRGRSVRVAMGGVFPRAGSPCELASVQLPCPETPGRRAPLGVVGSVQRLAGQSRCTFRGHGHMAYTLKALPPPLGSGGRGLWPAGVPWGPFPGELSSWGGQAPGASLRGAAGTGAAGASGERAGQAV